MDPIILFIVVVVVLGGALWYFNAEKDDTTVGGGESGVKPEPVAKVEPKPAPGGPKDWEIGAGRRKKKATKEEWWIHNYGDEWREDGYHKSIKFEE